MKNLGCEVIVVQKLFSTNQLLNSLNVLRDEKHNYLENFKSKKLTSKQN